MKFLKQLLIPQKENNFLPKIINSKALVLYAVLSVLIFFVISPAFLNIDKLLALLTQDLVIQEINPIRESQGYLKLKSNDKLSSAAQMKAEDMIEKDYFDHVGPDGKTAREWIEEADYDFAAAAENLAVDASNPKALIKAWLNSPSHAKNILNGYFTDIGVGIAKGELGERNTIVVVMFLGREMPQETGLSSAVIADLKKNTPKPESLAISEEIENVSVSEPVIIQTVEEDVLFEDNIVMTAEQASVQEEPVQRTEAKLFLLSSFPVQARFALTLFFNALILWALLTLFISREKFFLRAFNSLIVLTLLFFIWLPEIV